MKIPKSLLSIIMALALALVCCIPAFAADPPYQYHSQKYGSGNAHGQYPVITLSSEYQKRYPKLDQQIQKVNRQNQEEVKKKVDEMRSSKTPIYYSIEVTPGRLINSIFSIGIEKNLTVGETHTQLYSSLNYNPKTGKALAPKDVLKNRDQLIDATLGQFFSQHPELEELKTAVFSDGTTLKQRLTQQFDTGTLLFSLDKNNILHIYLNGSTLDMSARKAYHLPLPIKDNPYVQDLYNYGPTS